MKIKELPNSLVCSLNLLRISKKKLGLNAKNHNPRVIVSLTSIPYRIPRLHLVIRSLLNQNTSFNKIILWLHKSLQGKLPKKLTSLQSGRFEIRFSIGTSSHRKLVETLKIYPNEYIVTCDDDMMYPSDWLERLLETQSIHPNAVIAHMCRVIRYKSDELMPYKTWESEVSGQGSLMTLAVGAGGVLYPPNCLHEDITNESLYHQLAPKADDLWFKAMSLMKGTIIFNTKQSFPEPVPIMLTQKYSLKKSNVLKDENKSQWMKIAQHYNLKQLLDE